MEDEAVLFKQHASKQCQHRLSAGFSDGCLHDLIIRFATMADVEQLQLLMEQSIRQLSIAHYNPAQIDGSVGYLFGPDTQLIEDQTYFVIVPRDDPSLIVACGGWSFRKTVYGSDQGPNRIPERSEPNFDAAKIRAIFVHPSWTRRGLGTAMMQHCEQAAKDAGYTQFEMGSTLTGVSLYTKCGYRKVYDEVVLLPNGENLLVIKMKKQV